METKHATAPANCLTSRLREEVRHHVFVTFGKQDGPEPRHLLRREGFLGLYDLPLVRDWAFWTTLGWGILAALSLGFGKNNPGLPRWGNVLLGAPTFMVLFGVVPTSGRRIFRKRVARNKERQLQHPRLSEFELDERNPTSESNIASEPEVVGERNAGGESPARRTEPPVQLKTEPQELKQEPLVVTAASSENLIDLNSFRISEPPPITKPSIAASSTTDMPSLELARTLLPYPIARAARAIQRAGDMRERYEEMLSAGEAVSITLGVSIVSCLSNAFLGSPAFEELRMAFISRGVAEGHWVELIASTFGVLKGRDEVLPGLTEALKPGKGGSGLVADLKVLLEERNRWAHGSRPRSSFESEKRMAEMKPALERILDRCSFLANSPWYLTEASAYQRREGRFAITAAIAMGDHPEFGRTEFESQIPLANETFYIMTPERVWDLTPFVVNRYCEICLQPEILYADRLDQRDGVALKSFARGHVVFDTELKEDLMAVLASA
jgi:hypothetical protein